MSLSAIIGAVRKEGAHWLSTFENWAGHKRRESLSLRFSFAMYCSAAMSTFFPRLHVPLKTMFFSDI